MTTTNTKLIGKARDVLRSRVRRHADLSRMTADPHAVGTMTTPDLLQLATLLRLNPPTDAEMQAYERAAASGVRGVGIKAADAYAVLHRIGGDGLADVRGITDSTDAEAARDDTDDQGDTPDADAAPVDVDAAPVDADAEQKAAASAAVKRVMGLFANGDVAGFQTGLLDLATQAHRPDPAPVTIVQPAVDVSKIAGTVPKVVGRKTMTQAGIAAPCVAHDNATALDVYDAPDAPQIMQGYVWHDHTAPALAALAAGQNVFLTGPAGTGKTTMAEQVAARFGRPFVRISCDDQTEAATLTGMTVPDAAGGVKWQDGQLARAVRRPGTVILLDEPSVARSTALMVMQSVLDDARAINVAETGERIPVAPGVLFFMADNTNGTGDQSGAYEGTRRVNRAFLDRWAMTVVVGYMPPADEARILKNRAGLANKPALALAKFAALTRTKAEHGHLSHGVGLRRLIAMGAQLAAGTPQDLAFSLCVLNSVPADDVEPLRQLWASEINATSFGA